ncbi:hypothetical protein B0A55_01353 [Friedmanniomyces simplex]|uniref:Uncharacterized protein n=1 Tax=Friedmanniomyces simplex TaxID=329884 RepID=A0A4U0Y025_9PEZI|nr:hypothetical protein B0A55_01353 [Friedmanniomyces simplex]
MQRASNFGSLRNHILAEAAPCTLEGYEGVIWSRLPGYRVPTDDKKVRTWVLKDGHGWRVEKISDNTHWWVCKECHLKRSPKPHIYCITRATSAAVGHLAGAPHLITEDGPVAKKRCVRDGAMDAFLTGAAIANGSDPVNAAQNEEAAEFDGTHFKMLLYDWIITESISFRQLNSPKLHASATSSLAASRYYHTAAHAITNMNISFDLWTSGNKLAPLGVVASFINSSGSLTTTLLALPRQHSKHSGYNMAQNILER